jgi:hypothetical protein
MIELAADALPGGVSSSTGGPAFAGIDAALDVDYRIDIGRG